MARQKKRNVGNKLLHRVKRKRLKSITVLPSLVTIINGICGFAAIVLAGKAAAAPPVRALAYHNLPLSGFSLAGYMILLAMIADVLDGRLARMSQSTSSFGGQLDSLCDIISFGVAPAFLMLKILEYKLAGSANLTPNVQNFLLRFFWLASAAYITCAAIRLARFNVENEQSETAHMSFIGLPTPAAAGVVVSLVIFHQQTLPELLTKNTNAYLICENIIIYAMPVLLVAAAILMISRVRYPHLVNQYVKGEKPLAHLIWLLLGIGVIIWNLQAALVLIFCGFAAAGFVKWFYYRFIKKRTSAANQPDMTNLWTQPRNPTPQHDATSN